MIYDLYLTLQIFVIIIFFVAFFSKQEIIWAVSLVLSGILMFTSYSVQISTYMFNATSGAYDTILISHSFPFMMGVNMLFFALSLLLGMFDLFDKYGISTAKIVGKLK